MNEARFTVKFNNGFHKVFDNQEYTDAALHYLKTEAIKHAEFLNNRTRKESN